MLKIVLSICLAIVLPACVNRTHKGQEKTEAVKLTIEEAQQKLTDQFMSLPGVVGTAVTEFEGEPCLMIMIAEGTDELLAKIPDTFEGYRVVIHESGEIRALPRRRPDP